MHSISRNYQFDTIKALLIFLVVLGHLFELSNNPISLWLYQVIYSFHMPTFIFCSGVFSRWSAGRLFHNLVYPYFVYQTLYLVFAHFALQKPFTLQYKQPYWILWYLFSLILWTLLLPLLHRTSAFTGIIALLISCVVSLAAGFADYIGYPFSLSRTLCMLPFFVAGYYLHQYFDFWMCILKKLKFPLFLFCSCIIVYGCFFLWHYHAHIKSKWFYGSYSYTKANYTPLIRGMILLFAVSWIIWLFCVIPQKKIPFISQLGRYTLSIYLLHGFVVKMLSALPACKHFFSNVPVACFFVSLLICFTLGNSIIFRAFSFTFSSKWISVLYARASFCLKTRFFQKKS